MPDDDCEEKPDRANFLESWISDYSHEFRTPMYNAELYAELLLNGEAGTHNEKQREWITHIHDMINRTIELHNTFVTSAFDSNSNSDATEYDE